MLEYNPELFGFENALTSLYIRQHELLTQVILKYSLILQVILKYF